jgi:hypothetical protein
LKSLLALVLLRRLLLRCCVLLSWLGMYKLSSLSSSLLELMSLLFDPLELSVLLLLLLLLLSHSAPIQSAAPGIGRLPGFVIGVLVPSTSLPLALHPTLPLVWGRVGKGVGPRGGHITRGRSCKGSREMYTTRRGGGNSSLWLGSSWKGGREVYTP